MMNMKVKITRIFLLFALLIPSVGLADEPDQAIELKTEIILMRQSVNELVQLLKSQQQETSKLQELQIAVTYLSFRSRSIELKEWDLRQKKEARDRIEDMIAKIESDPDAWDKRFKTFQTSNNSQLSSDEPRPSERRIKMLQERIESLDSDILKTELEIQEVKNELEIYEAYVQKKLNIEN
jgi:hypothetical protein